MPRPSPDPEIVAKALELVDLRIPYQEIADVFGVTEGTIRQWAKKRAARASEPAPGPPPEDVPAHMAPPPSVPPAAPLPLDPLEMIRQMVREQNDAVQRERAMGSRGASSAAATLSRMFIALKQLEADHARRGSEIQVSATELAAADADLTARLSALGERPILCAHCARALSVEWGTGTDEP